MHTIIKRIIKKLYPEIAAGLHVPQWARVVNTPGAITGDEISDAVAPLYAVDVQLCDAHGVLDPRSPVFEQVPLPVNMAGNARGVFGFPLVGALVEIGFIQGLPHKPFIRTVLIEGLTVPALGVDDLLMQHSGGVYQRADGGGNWTRTTPTDITDTGDNYVELIEKIKRSHAKLQNSIEVDDGGAVYVGDQSNNALALLADTMASVIAIADALKIHKHLGVTTGAGVTGAPDNAASYIAESATTTATKGKLDAML